MSSFTQFNTLQTRPSPDELRIKVPFNANAADTTNTDYLWTGDLLQLPFALTGSDITVGIWDKDKVYDQHFSFLRNPPDPSSTRVISGGDNASDFSDHATHVAGTIGAAGGITSVLRGMANEVKMVSYDYLDDYKEIVDFSKEYHKSPITNHSYGALAGWTTEIRWPAQVGNFDVDTWIGDIAKYDPLKPEDPSFGKYAEDILNDDPSANEDLNIFANPRQLDQVLYSNPTILSIWAAGNDQDDDFSNAAYINSNKMLPDGSFMTYRSSASGGPGWYFIDAPQFSILVLFGESDRYLSTGSY